MKILCVLFPLFVLASITPAARAGSATWNANPTSDYWSYPSNWTLATVPANTADTATFNSSNITSLEQAQLSVGRIVFNPGASAYTLTPTNPAQFTMAGAGVINNSGVMQKFNLPAVPVGVGDEEALNRFTLSGSATAGSLTQYTVSGSPAGDGKTNKGGLINFVVSATAEQASFILSAGGGVGRTERGLGGQVGFFNTSTASTATFTADGGAIATGNAAEVFFTDSATAASATITNNGGTVSGAVGGLTLFYGQASAGSAVIVGNAAPVIGGLGGLTVFTDTATAANATLIGNAGIGQGGQIRFFSDATGGTARIEVFGNGALDLSEETNGLATGSIEGDGLVFLGAKNLAVGGNGSSTLFAGVLQDGGLGSGTGGSLTKGGEGTLTLSGPSTYTGATTVTQGTLVVGNLSGSATGAGPVLVSSGRLGGGGTVAGAVMVGMDGADRAVLSPGLGLAPKVTFTTLGSVTFNGNSTYICSFRVARKLAVADQVAANGVTIASGAIFRCGGQAQGQLRQGTTLTVLRNTSASAISGTFSNLGDGAILTVNGFHFQASYAGGDGNDLTLTVVP